MRFEHRLTFTADCAAERPDDATVERANAHLETLVQPMLRGKMDGYTAATLMETGLFTAVDVDREHHWVSGDGYTQLLSTMEFPAPKSTRRLGGVIWSGFAADTSARNKLHEFRGMRYTVRGETKAMHSDMVCYGLNGAQRGLSGLPAEQRRYPHPYNPGGLEMSEEARELFVDHAEDFTTVLEKYAPALVDSKRRVVASAAADRYSISEKAPAFAFAISISYVASPHDDHRETHPSAILFVCRESVHDWVFQAGPYLIRLPSTPGMARLVVLNGVSVKHGTCYSTINPDHANLGSVLLMEHDMMVEISKWNVDHGRLHTTMSAFAPGYYKGMYATNGCVNPQLLDQFTLHSAIPMGPPTIPIASPISVPNSIAPPTVPAVPTADAVTPPIAPPLTPPIPSAVSSSIPPRTSALVIAFEDSAPAMYAAAPAKISGPRDALAPSALAPNAPIPPAIAPSVASDATAFILWSGSMVFMIACAARPDTAPVAREDVFGIMDRMTVSCGLTLALMEDW